eukprot:m.71182 g.71182  ORF g.71182 m.71182 type:complete len:96 (-) comp24323_c0_seq4:1685-1972(-)
MQATYVEKIEGGSVAVFLTVDRQKITIPCCLLPNTAQVGSIIDLQVTVSQGFEQSKELLALQHQLQDSWRNTVALKKQGKQKESTGNLKENANTN